MASCWIPQLLALEVSTTTRQAQGASRSSAADPRDEPGKSFLGRSSHPWRAPQARHRCRPDFGCQVHGPTPAPTVAGLENVPPEPCRWDRLDRSVRGSDDLIAAAVRVACPPTRSKAHSVAPPPPAPQGRKGIGERATLSHPPDRRQHSSAAGPRRPTPPLRPDLISRRDS